MYAAPNQLYLIFIALEWRGYFQGLGWISEEILIDGLFLLISIPISLGIAELIIYAQKRINWLAAIFAYVATSVVLLAIIVMAAWLFR